MAEIHLDPEEIATVAWFLETAVVSLKEALEEEGETEGVGDAVRVRDLHDLEDLRQRIQLGLRSQSPEGSEEAVELPPEQLRNLARLAGDALRLCRGETPHKPLETPPALADASGLEGILEGVQSKAQGHPEFPDRQG